MIAISVDFWSLPLHAFQSSCAERGETLKHEKVINPLQSHKVVCLDSEDSASLPLASGVEKGISSSMTLCNWNVYGLPVQKSGRRQVNIANYVAYGCDIFSGQEHWSPFDRSRFRREARHQVPGWNFKYFGHPILLHPGSGIMIGSIWPIQKTKYSPWPGGVGRNAGYKGVGYAQIQTPHGLVDLYNLHLAAGRSVKLKERQLEHLVGFVQKTHEFDVPLILTGDFNFNQRWMLPSRQMNALTWLREKLGVRSVGFKKRIEYTLINEQLKYLDHRVLADWASPNEVYMSEPFVRELGDHPGVITKVEFTD